MSEEKQKAPLEKKIRQKCAWLADFLVEKNQAYGNSAAEPVAIFAKRLDKLAQIDTRIDDKLSRLKKGNEYPGDDTIKDLAGYLILRMIVAETPLKNTVTDVVNLDRSELREQERKAEMLALFAEEAE
jgi:hypothetical protein